MSDQADSRTSISDSYFCLVAKLKLWTRQHVYDHHIVLIILLRPAIASEQLESFSEHTYCFNDRGHVHASA